MQLALFLAESEVSSLEQQHGGLVIRLSAASVQRASLQQEEEPTQGYSRGVSLWLHGAQVESVASPFIGRVSGGTLQVGGSPMKSIPIPFESSAPVHLELLLANHSYLLVSAQWLRVRFDGEVNFSESFAC